MSQARAELISALNDNDSKRIQSLILHSFTPIHDQAFNGHSHTPLQHALALPTPLPLRTLLTSFFASSHSGHTQQQTAVIDELLVHLYPNFHTFAEETKEGLNPNTTSSSNNTDPLSDQSESAIMARVRHAISCLSAGSFVVVCDREDRENEGDLIIAAECVTAEKIAFMVNETSGIICVGILPDRVEALNLPQMVQHNTESHRTAFTVTVDYNIGTTTGISAADRATTIQALANPNTTAQQLNRPGHIFPLRARAGGVLERPGHTEASVDLARLAGFTPIGVMCEIVNKDGSMQRPQQLKQWSQRHGLAYMTIADLIYYRKKTEGIHTEQQHTRTTS